MNMSDDRDDISANERIAELESQLAAVMARLESVESGAAGSTAHTTTSGTATGTATGAAVDDDTNAEGASRRNLLRLALGAAAGGAVVAATSNATPVAADDGDAVIAGDTTTSGTAGRAATTLQYVNDESPQVTTFDANIFTVHDEPDVVPSDPLSRSSSPAAVAGYAYRTVPFGVYGFSTSFNGAGVIGRGAVGLVGEGERANLYLQPAGPAAPPDRTGAQAVGDVVVDESGDLWFCVEAGLPGAWRKISGGDTAGAFHAVTPFRVYDSRQETDGAFAGDENRTISVADARDVDTYAVVAAGAVPAGASAITGNVVAIGTSDTGFLSINPGGVSDISAATVNWTSGQNIGNAGVFALDADRQVEAVFGPGNGCHMTIDVTGYWR